MSTLYVLPGLRRPAMCPPLLCRSLMCRSLAIALSAAVLFLLSYAGSACAQATGEDSVEANRALRSGDYLRARAGYEQLFASSLQTASVHAPDYAETFLATGEYTKGLEQITSLLRQAPDDPYLLHAQGLLLVEIGRIDEAEQAFRNAGRQKNDFWRNALEHGLLLEKVGHRNQAMPIFDALFQRYKQAQFKTAEELRIAGRAAARLEAYHDANEAFRNAYRIDPEDVKTLYWWAELFREKYNDADAQRTYEEALKIIPHAADLLVGYARSQPSFSRQEELAREALSQNPNNVDALTLLAELHVLDAQYQQAEELLLQALDINPSSVMALGQLASIYLLREDSTAYENVEKRALDVNPHAGDFYLTISENLSRRFRYPAALAFAQKAVDVDRYNIEAYANLGSALLRTGNTREARRYLEAVYDRDPFNLYAGNTLTLLDEYADFDELESEHFQLIIHKNESAVLGHSILAVAEVCYDSLTARYPYRPEGKIRLEAYNDHDDFAVRIAGIPHLGLLGVSFGDIVAFDTPKAQSDNPHNWARTLWHELAHTMAIGVSDFHVPRWFTEGLSVYEEKRARPEWGREMDLQLFSAFEAGELLPLAEIDRGFTRPRSAGEVLLSYYHASKVIEFIVDQYGFDAITGTLSALREGHPLDAAFQNVLGTTTAELDQSFRQHLEEEQSQFSRALRGMPGVLGEEKDEGDFLAKHLGQSNNAFLETLHDAQTLLQQERYDAAESRFRQALDIYPFYTGEGNPYTSLARIYNTRNETQKEIDILVRYLDVADYGAEEARRLAELYRNTGNTAGEERYLLRSLDVEPYNIDVRSRLADLYRQRQDFERAIRERQAILALNPVDRAVALYNLARDLYSAGKISEAKRTTLQSLEQAPGYRDAQKLLLQCVSDETPGS